MLNKSTRNIVSEYRAAYERANNERVHVEYDGKAYLIYSAGAAPSQCSAAEIVELTRRLLERAK